MNEIPAVVRYRVDERIEVGVLHGDEVHPLPLASLADLWALSRSEIQSTLEAALREAARHTWAEVALLAPIDGRTEVWGAGVAYKQSRTARAEESSFDRVYTEVYAAERPELFFKSPAWRVVTNGESVGTRADCTDTVPEPELTLVVNAHGELVGALICNDMTARSVEAQNPIYLPQAKVYNRGCAISDRIVPWWLLKDPEDLTIMMQISRGSDTIFEGRTSTTAMRRTYDELSKWTRRAIDFPDGVLISTGTGIVPPLGEGVRSDDVITVMIDQLGSLSNPVVVVGGGDPS